MSESIIEIYTDGSCNPKEDIGAWAAILQMGGQQIIIKGISKNTTHNRMELTAVIEALDYLQKNGLEEQPVAIFTDSQYVEKIKERATKIEQQQYQTKKGNPMRNADLVEILIKQINSGQVSFEKVKAHQKAGEKPNLNREVDKIVRKLLRASYSGCVFDPKDDA